MAKKPVRRKTVQRSSGSTSARKKTSRRPPSRRGLSEPSWLKALRKRKQPLSLAIDDQGQIEFWKYSFEGPHDYNLIVWHPEGDLDFGFDEPDAEDDEEMSDPAISEWDNQYRPGHPIHDALTPKERQVLGISQGDAGGPASGGCMVTRAECSMDQLNEIIRKKKLPFVVVEDRRIRRAEKLGRGC